MCILGHVLVCNAAVKINNSAEYVMERDCEFETKEYTLERAGIIGTVCADFDNILICSCTLE